MSDVREAIGAVAGLLFAGYILILMSTNIDAELGINLTFWGGVYILVAILLGAALVLGIVKTIVNQV
ncbi:hypothetical protein KM295_15015 [Natronomonas sp. F2-12]|jgi:hypothetical protein|uniref:Uncharacterized protein n=1 Tax=Natronomonas aquatica TaxID=2841590 RepID=A0A9R1CSX7_9EURY|nr:hypothetical protein [Natronomonas aquatica]MCQ4334763.1 hypothetical protein [Natronomonas aquatica]